MHLGISMSLHLRTAADDDDDSSSGTWSRSRTVATAASSQICALADCRLGRHALRLCALAVFSSFRSFPILPNLVHSRPPPLPLLLLRSYLLISPSSVFYILPQLLAACAAAAAAATTAGCCVLLAAAPPRPNTAFVAWPWPRGTGLRKDGASVPQPVIGAITFVVVTQEEQGGRQSRPQLAPEPISASLLVRCPSHNFCAGRCACWLLPGIRHTHARTRARTRVSTYPSCLYHGHSFPGNWG